VHIFFISKTGRIRSPGKPKRICKDNIKINLKEINLELRIGLAWFIIGAGDGLL
jgi:hypothetical protein